MGEDDLRFVSLVGISTPRSPLQAIANTLDEVAPDDVEVGVLDDLAHLPPFAASLREDIPDAIATLASQVAKGDAVVIVSLVADGPLSPLLTNAFAWLDASDLRPLIGKAAAVITASAGSSGASEPDDRLRITLATLGAVVLGEPCVHVSDMGSKVDLYSACLRDVEMRHLIGSQLAALAVLARERRHQRSGSG